MYFINKLVRIGVGMFCILIIYIILIILIPFIALWDWDKAKEEARGMSYWDDVKNF